MRVTQPLFLRYQEIFYNQVVNADMTIELGIEEVPTPSGDFLTDFTGSNDRTITWHPFTALFDTNIEVMERGKFGLGANESGTIFLSPLQLVPVFGTFKINLFATHVRMLGGDPSSPTDRLITRVSYLEQLYGSCIAVQLDTKEAIRGEIA